MSFLPLSLPKEQAMTDDSILKKMQFIVKQRAKFAAAIQVMRENHAADSARMKEQSRALKRAMTSLAVKIRKLEKAQQRRRRNISRDESAKIRRARRVGKSAAAAIRSDDPLKRLIDTIERRISESRSKRSEVRS